MFVYVCGKHSNIREFGDRRSLLTGLAPPMHFTDKIYKSVPFLNTVASRFMQKPDLRNTRMPAYAIVSRPLYPF